ncbi:hypothetical protein [Paenibacillus piri]|uniref:Uncharacterized protein n=1 Tax=Paenibacillus piri TaxID=2547395 RepID=A0A4R5K603_9BACL|nr:hypothetical protein [Paenibacillus piri]TDF88916.1 hypothetical protein E1757_35070 [Paenibacillus piri]
MQAYSYDMRDPVYEIAGMSISIHIITVENIYGLRPESVTLHHSHNRWTLDCSKLAWAGRQRSAEGWFSLVAERNGKGQIEIRMEAEAQHKIKSIKLMIRGLEPLTVFDYNFRTELSVDLGEDKLQVPGQVFFYPYNALKYTNNLKAPILFTRDKSSSRLTGFRSDDSKVRGKRFVVAPELSGAFKDKYTVELIHEANATEFDKRITIPSWIIQEGADPDAFYEDYLTFAESENGIGLVPWEKRTDFPAWLKDVALSLTIHGMHWSGYIFNKYEQMLDIIQYAAERIDGKHILVYLPGWEGRYYWQYGDYRPEPMLGGEEGFLRLCEETRKLGVHLMPMFGANCVNMWFHNFSEYGPNSFMKSPARTRYHIPEPDWDLSRGHDNGWQAFVNTGAPSWRKELVGQITELADKYPFDSVFLDLVHHWVNDPDHDVFEGMRLLKNDINTKRPDLLVVGENWYDGLLSIFPLFQVRPFLQQPAWVGRYARTVAHLLEAEPSRGSTGVHERGFAPYSRRPISKEYIPTVSFVDGTLEHAKEEIDRVIQDAHQYKKQFLKP